MTLNTFQLAIVRQYAPDALINDTFYGDDNDLACIVSNAARQEAKRGDVAYATAIEMNAAPAGSFNATESEMRDYLASLVDPAQVAAEDEKTAALGCGTAADARLADIATAKRSPTFIAWMQSFLPARAYYLQNLAA